MPILSRLPNRLLATLVALVVVGVDVATKDWALNRLQGDPITVIDGFLRLAVARNPGASFSSFQGSGSIIGLLAIGVAIYIAKMAGEMSHRMEVVGLGIILGGALGNLVDRVFRGDGFLDGAVVDFIDFSFFPTFNMADTFLWVGVGTLVIGGWLAHRASGTTEE
jgi:signal peptidase II